MDPIRKFAMAICLIAAVPMLHVVNADQVSALARIVAIKAMPYYPETGVIRRSTDLFDKRLVLRNVVMPEGGAGDPLRRNKIEDWDIAFGTTATYVEVDIESIDFTKLPKSARVEMRARATDTQRDLTTESVALSSLTTSSGRTLHVPFFVYGTGCETLELRVRLLAESNHYGEIVRTIPFSCGE